MHALYSKTDRKRFADYFDQPERKVGRPRKKKRRYRKKNKEKAKAKKTKQEKALERKESKARKRLNFLDDKLAGEAAKLERNKLNRTNWDIEPNFSYRDRCVTSWMCRCDLWRVGEKFARFAERVGIDRGVLTRYMEKLKKQSASNKKKPRGKKRGRKPMLPVSVMHHLCEGQLLFSSPPCLYLIFPVEISSCHHIALCSGAAA